VQISQADIIQQNKNELLISGVVDFLTVPDLVRKSLDFLKSYKSIDSSAIISVDLSKVTSCNSAGLALMLEMVRNARVNNVELLFDNLPNTLLTIAKAYGVENEIRDICK